MKHAPQPKQLKTHQTPSARQTRAEGVSFYTSLRTPFGGLGISTGTDVLGSPVVLELKYLPANCAVIPPQDALGHEVVAQIQAYLQQPDFNFSLPLAERGTHFQQRLRQHMLHIPCGQVQTYGQVAQALKSGPRAVGQACGANPFPLLVPCHRIVSAQGIGGFANADDGFYIGIKRWLLAHEGVRVD